MRSADSAEPADAFAQLAFALGLGEGADDIGEGGEVDAAAGFDGFDAKRHGEMRFAGAGRAEEVDDLTAIDELELGEGEDALAVERGLEGEVEAGEGLDRREAAHAQRRLDTTGSRARVSSSASSVSISSSALASPRSSWRTAWSSTSRARGILRATRVRRMRSRTGRLSPDAIMADRLRRRAGGRPPRRSRAIGAPRRRRRRPIGTAAAPISVAVSIGILRWPGARRR